jgi:hypothetical protein
MLNEVCQEIDKRLSLGERVDGDQPVRYVCEYLSENRPIITEI